MPMATLRNYFFLVMIESVILVFNVHEVYLIDDISLKNNVKEALLFIFTLMNINFAAMCSFIINQEYYCIYLMSLLKINEIVLRFQIIRSWRYNTVIDTLYIIAELLFVVLFYTKWDIIYPIIVASFNERVGSNQSVFKAYNARNLFKACRLNSYLVSTFVAIFVFCAVGNSNVYNYVLLGKLFLYTIEYYACGDGDDEDKKKKLLSIAFWVLFAGHSITASVLLVINNKDSDLNELPYYIYSVFNTLTLLSNIRDYMMYGKGLKTALLQAKADKKSRPFYKKYRAI